jgi:hypothetical protein
MAKTPSKTTCLIRGCQNPVQGRGLCKACHSSAAHLIRTGTTTWEELEELGLAIGKRESLFIQAFQRVKNKKKTHKSLVVAPQRGRGRPRKDQITPLNGEST